MQNKFVGDIGDFANNGLLRYLCGVTGPSTDNPLHLGVAWYLNENESDDGSGNRIEYLNVSKYNDSQYRECDEDLYDKLQKLVGASLTNKVKRNIGQIIDGSILPDNTKHHTVPIPTGDRTSWIKDAVQYFGEANLIFANPDTGIASIKQRGNLKTHLRISELTHLFEGEKSLVIYQSLGQRTPEEETINDISDRLKQELKPMGLWMLRWCRAPIRAYFVVARTQEHKDTIEKQLVAFRNSPWMTKGHFTEQSF